MNKLASIAFAAALLLVGEAAPSDNLLYFCTAIDHRFFSHVLNLIGSIHEHDFEHLGEIAVFDIGLNQAQRNELNRIQKVCVYTIDLVHPQLLTPFKTRAFGKPVPGWYAWKPVAIKQALELFPRVLWIDAGTTVLKSLVPLFKHIESEGYFFHNGSDCPVANQLTRYACTKLEVLSPEHRWILDPATRGVEAGLMGFSKRMLESFVIPLYQLAHDIALFADDGSAPDGFGGARHDTSVYSVMANCRRYHIHQHGKSPAQTIALRVDGTLIDYHITYEKSYITPLTSVYISRNDVNLARYGSHIKYKNS